MSKKIVRPFFILLLLSSAVLFFYNLTGLVTAQEKQNRNSTDKNEICQNCCDACREKFYSDCSLSPTKSDNFGVLNHETEMAILDKFVTLFNGSSGLDAYIVVYGGKTNKYGEMEERTDRIKKYLLDYRKLDPSQIKFVTGGFREKFEVELWLSPVKNSYPPLTPTILPEKVKFTAKIKTSNF